MEIRVSNIIIAITSTFLVFICGCSNTSEVKKYKIGFSQCISTDDWRKSMDYEMTVEASLNPELDLTIFQANGDVETQRLQIESMINGGFDLIIIFLIEPGPRVTAVEKVYEKGIPVIN